MKIKTILISLGILTLLTCLWGDVKIQYADSDEYYLLETFEHKQLNYFKLNEFNQIVAGQVKETLLDDRLYFYLFKKEITFCLESSFAHVSSHNRHGDISEDEYYNFFYPIVYLNGEYCLPEHFLKDIFPQIFVTNSQYKDDFLILNKKNRATIKVIVLDPGHGGKDPGAEGANGLQEKNIVLSVAKKLKARIEQELDVCVWLTREDDSFVSLKDRTIFANNKCADLFISIHTNAADNKKANGVEVYYLSEPEDAQARAAQALENSVVEEFEGEEALQEYAQASLITSDITQRAYLNESVNLAYKFQNNMVFETQAVDRGVKFANFFVLRGAFMPSVLVEMGFISHKDEGIKLKQDDYQNQLVESMFYGIKSFKSQCDRDNGQY